MRWAEVDMQKIVFNAHYLMYFDTAIADYWRALALPYEEAMHALGGDLYVRKATIEFNASARVDDVLDVGDEVRARRQLVDRLPRRAVPRRRPAGDAASWSTCSPIRPRRPRSRCRALLREIFTAYEAGEAMSEVATGSWAELGEGAGAVRRERLHRGAAHSQGTGMGRARRDAPCMRWRATGWAR